VDFYERNVPSVTVG